jgi:glycosyltransferase involved in cell wall biosynthesis
MRTSILTPSWNYGRFLDDCLDSVEAQRAETQHVVQDNCSTDETVSLLQRRDPARVDWVSEPDGGQSDALNKALRRATGDCIGWLNADEFYLPNAIALATTYLSEHPEVDVVYGDTVFVNEVGGVERLLTRIGYSPTILRWRGCYISTCAAFIRRTALDGFRFDESLRVVMDWDLYLHIAARGGRMVYLPVPLGAFRAHAGRVTAQPMSRDSAEHQRVRAKFGIDGPLLKVKALRACADVGYSMRKVLTGARRRETQVTPVRGSSVVWMHGDSRALANVARLA